MTAQIPHHLQRFTTRNSTVTRRLGALVRTNRFVLTGALVVAVLVPELLHSVLRAYPWARLVNNEDPSIYAAALAIVAAHLTLQKTAMLPRANDKALVVPTMLCAFACAALAVHWVLGAAGFYHLVTGFAAGTAWYIGIMMLRARLNEPRLAFAGNLALEEPLRLSRIEWLQLSEPVLPEDVQGIVFDKLQPLPAAFERLFSRAVLRSIPVYELAELREMITGRVQLDGRPEEVFGKVLPSQPYLRLKPLIELVIVIPLLPLVLPVIGLFALLVRLESPGPAIFRQERIGYKGRRFTCYKLRTMRIDASGPTYTREADPRITRLGKFLRKTRIDELPQFFNILKGEMSLIGPRPEAVPLGRDYHRQIPFYEYRHLVRPGIAGWAAVHQGNVALADAARVKLEYDFYYIKNLTIWLDFLIVMMTIRTIFTGFGSR